ncbi:MAG: GTPase HflX [Caldicoprobacter oshimai]|uniref:GTPase HflX n=1 Tax=Caldicoprobacter faecalis TaxID=937334 RepID=A0A1I5YA64_9FIRM|nr:GTPase HflX [Caldicoprobacter faecalis]PZN10650.1 MAG: GTPase HflX [Caldicoprobacter oshimai]SFQ41104.1 GTP-binding protein HflX [Caldicoprobacter faecalis]
MRAKENEVLEKAVLVGIIESSHDQESMEELKDLAETAGAQVVGVITQKRKGTDSAYYIGKGKLEELKSFIQGNEVDVVIVNDELSGSQIKNIEDFLGIKIVDRTCLILDIFASRARTKESKLQVELAQLKYRLPRLTGMGGQLSRLGGGIGTRGPGETKLETDRRHIQNRIKSIEKKLAKFERHRNLYRQRRAKNRIPVVSIVGYTNAGKSTLFNALAKAQSYVEDKLFATLDTSARKLILPSGMQVVLVDTVGFIRDLPHDLVEGFKSTLEEVRYSDLLLHVIDITSSDVDEKIQVVERILSDLNAIDIPRLDVFNKIDLIDTQPVANNKRTIFVSAKKGIGLDALKEAIENELAVKR